jgi:hypothetical protein
MQTRTVSGARPVGASTRRVSLAAVQQVRASAKRAAAALVPPLPTQSITPGRSSRVNWCGADTEGPVT